MYLPIENDDQNIDIKVTTKRKKQKEQRGWS